MFHFADIRGAETSHLSKVKDFMQDFCASTAAADLLPGVINIDVNPVVETFDEVTGALVGTTVGTKPATIDGTGTGSFQAPAGACISWMTNLIHDVPGAASGPHIVRGRTFFVPMVSAIADVDGTITTPTLSGFNTAVSTFIAANPDFVIWSRPVNGAGGAFGVVVAGVVRDKIAVLRSRRD